MKKKVGKRASFFSVDFGWKNVLYDVAAFFNLDLRGGLGQPLSLI
jgi:hypothetical protein